MRHRLDSKGQHEGKVLDYRVSELRVVGLLDGLCEKMQDYTLEKLESGERAWVKVRDWDSLKLISRKLVPTQRIYPHFVEGKIHLGPTAEKGAVVQVHFDCIYRGITAVSSRESKLLAGNRSIAQPYEFTVGSPPGKERKRDFVDNANGLYSAQSAPKPPPAMYTITEGMKVGGKRTVIVPPELGYGKKGMNEIPPGAEFQLNIELLQVTPPARR
uniref:peptidylprolyl isomerase n=1 Tax=Ananas comosus var. bracteatus TaxID=296719 RepID=A0A6V7QCK7_ANACO|nr:unnamed protein product [Ananas comosus var. bracteatus]